MFNFIRIKSRKGMATLIALMVMLMMTLIGLAALQITEDEITIAGNELNEMSAFYAAESGLERASASIQEQYSKTNAPPTQLPAGNENISQKTITTYVTNDMGAATQKTLTQGTVAGLKALVKTYQIESIGTSLVDGSQMRLSQNFECALVPIFQFAVFYDNDLEISPGPKMTITGRVHTNGDLWLNPYDDLNITDYVTCAGDIHHGPGGSYASIRKGDIYIKDNTGTYQNMKNANGTFLQSSDANWYESASARWGGRVQDAAFGQEELNMPITSSDPRKIIERYDGGSNPDSYEQKAEAKIIDGAYLVKIGSVWQDVSSLLPSGTITTGGFYDYREKTNVVTTDIDMNLLKTSSYFPSNGVIYSSDQRTGTFNALRLQNASDIGNPLSIFSENPMYVQGDYNTVNKQPAALAGDAITFLSNSWNDANASSSSSPFWNRNPSATTCNASIITGNTEMTSTVDNGGLENLLRYLEDWDYNIKYTINGSIVNLWHSKEAVGAWKVGSPVYTPPVRDYSYDTDLDDPNKLPPETPQIQIFQRTGWRQLDVGYTQSN